MRRRQYATRREICLRFVDLVSELREFGDGQAAVFVAVEALDEVQGAVLGVMQFVAQYRDRLVERDISLAAETTQTTACCTGLVGRLYCTLRRAGPILSVFPALIVHSKLKSVHPGFLVAFIF